MKAEVFTPSDDAPITVAQKKRIMSNVRYNNDIKAEWVQWATCDNSKVNLSDLNYGQAKMIILAQEGSEIITQDNWAHFDKSNSKHRYILSLCIQLQWSKKSDRHGEIADLNRLSDWLKSNRCPVQKPLLKMKPFELTKIVSALESMNVKHWSNASR